LRKVGALVEGAAFYEYMSGKHNLEIFSRTANDFNPTRIDELLSMVGLQDRADEHVGGYSTGMKQRLGIATALLGDPDLVILDEPTNGLDPAGIQEMRQFIRDLAHEHGKTVFLSSHLLHEVEQVCDSVGIINRGELVRASPVADLLAEGQVIVRVQASPILDAQSALSEKWQSKIDGEWIIVEAKPDDSPAIVNVLVSHNVAVHQVVVQRQTLEELFIEVTQNNDDGVPREGDAHD
jgi:ABC-2 type transport system ATP-binding protein